MAQLNLPTDPRTACWRLIKARLENDAALAASGLLLVFHDGDLTTFRDPTTYGRDVLVFGAGLGPVANYTEAGYRGALAVAYRAVLTSWDEEDILNLQGAIEQAMYPDDGAPTSAETAGWAGGATTFRLALEAAGSVTDEFAFQRPLTTAAAPADGQFRPDGVFTLAVRHLVHNHA